MSLSRQKVSVSTIKTVIQQQANRITTRYAAGRGSAVIGAWNDKLRELSKHGQYSQALMLYREMMRSGASPNAFTFPFVLKSSSALEIPFLGSLIHCHVIKLGCLLEPFVQTALISIYCRLFSVHDASNVFHEIPQTVRSTVSYNAFISGLIQRERLNEGMLLVRNMMANQVLVNEVTILGLVSGFLCPSNLILGMSFHSWSLKYGLTCFVAVANCFLSMYVRCGSLLLAKRLFAEIPEKGLITWNAMISGYSQNGLGTEVLDLYHNMKSLGVRPDEVTLVSVLSSCANLGAQSISHEVEKKIEDMGFGSNPFLKNSLISVYARCGNLRRARFIFDAMQEKNLVSWTAMIGAYGMHGHGEIAVDLFDKMIKAKIQPDGTVFVCLLAACSHAGLTEKGLKYFNSMEMYNLLPASEHYSCVVDLLGRAGRFADACKLIQSMPFPPDGAVWGALLGACKIHKNVDLAELAFNNVIEIEPTNIGYYVLLSNIYSETGDKKGVQRMRVMMHERGLRKDPGYSYVESKGKIHIFVAGDRSHPQTKDIYAKLAALEALEEPPGPGDQIASSKSAATAHSERLAIAFALLEADAGAEILVIKNLRICDECHAFVKAVTQVSDHRFVVRDATRFHHFASGTCSCNDYW